MSNKGWECPKCNKVYAPWKAECDHCNHETYEPVVAPLSPHEPITTPGTFPEWFRRYETICYGSGTSTGDNTKYEVYS